MGNVNARGRYMQSFKACNNVMEAKGMRSKSTILLEESDPFDRSRLPMPIYLFPLLSPASFHWPINTWYQLGRSTRLGSKACLWEAVVKLPLIIAPVVLILVLIFRNLRKMTVKSDTTDLWTRCRISIPHKLNVEKKHYYCSPALSLPDHLCMSPSYNTNTAFACARTLRILAMSIKFIVQCFNQRICTKHADTLKTRKLHEGARQ